MEIKIENAKAALKTADESVKKVLLALLPELKETEAHIAANRPIIERVKTFEDAVAILGDEHPLVAQFRVIESSFKEADNNLHLFAYARLVIIAAALNEGWEPQFTEEEWRWYPWHYLLTESELAEKSDDWKADRHLIMIGDKYQSEYAGFACAPSRNAASHTYMYFGSRLCFKSEALATYCGKQFIDLWADLNMIRK